MCCPWPVLSRGHSSHSRTSFCCFSANFDIFFQSLAYLNKHNHVWCYMICAVLVQRKTLQNRDEVEKKINSNFSKQKILSFQNSPPPKKKADSLFPADTFTSFWNLKLFQLVCFIIHLFFPKSHRQYCRLPWKWISVFISLDTMSLWNTLDSCMKSCANTFMHQQFYHHWMHNFGYAFICSFVCISEQNSWRYCDMSFVACGGGVNVWSMGAGFIV